MLFGKNIDKYSFDALKKTVCLCPQKAAVLSGDVRYNISLASSSKTDDELIEALKVAQAYDFVMQKGGLDAILEENGKNLSGGQKQRISLARAIASDAKIMIFDDCFSALDAATEKALRSALRERAEKNGTTIIIISQNVRSVRSCDKICVLDAGICVGVGTHDELLTSCHEYAEICSSQNRGDDSNEKA